MQFAQFEAQTVLAIAGTAKLALAPAPGYVAEADTLFTLRVKDQLQMVVEALTLRDRESRSENREAGAATCGALPFNHEFLKSRLDCAASSPLDSRISNANFVIA